MAYELQGLLLGLSPTLSMQTRMLRTGDQEGSAGLLVLGYNHAAGRACGILAVTEQSLEAMQGLHV